MKLSSISDVHLSPSYPERFKLFSQFISSKEVQESDIVVLLGDIFDIMVGNKKQYINAYQEYFNQLGGLLENDKKIIIVEGNHDFHTGEVYHYYFKKNHPDKIHNYQHIKSHKVISVNNKKVYLGHGDVLDYKNEAYKRWKSIYSSKLFKVITNILIPYKLVDHLGHRASKNSKKRSRDTFNYEASKDLYREGFVNMLQEYDFDIALTGHTHIKEDYIKDGKKLLNNGFFPQTKSFIYLDENNESLITLEESLK